MNYKNRLDKHRSGLESRREQRKSKQQRHPSARPLYVWFHGLFGFCLKEDHIVVVTPYMDEHSYFGGTWMQERRLSKGEWYRLRGVASGRNPATPPAIDCEREAVLSGVSKIDLDSSHFLMRLDFPKQIIPVRYVDATFIGRASSQLRPPFPLVHLFEYEITDPECLSLYPLEWKPQPNRNSLITSLHIFAEPEKIVKNEHAMHAFMSLVSMFPGIDLQLKDSSYKGQIVLDPNLPDGNLPFGLDPREELSLTERSMKSGTQPANCFALIGSTLSH